MPNIPDQAGAWQDRRPNAADIAKATAFVDGVHRICRDPEHHAFHRANNIRRVAELEMGKRRDTDWRTTVAVRVIQALAIAVEERSGRCDQPVKMRA